MRDVACFRDAQIHCDSISARENRTQRARGKKKTTGKTRTKQHVPKGQVSRSTACCARHDEFLSTNLKNITWIRIRETRITVKLVVQSSRPHEFRRTCNRATWRCTESVVSSWPAIARRESLIDAASMWHYPRFSVVFRPHVVNVPSLSCGRCCCESLVAYPSLRIAFCRSEGNQSAAFSYLWF